MVTLFSMVTIPWQQDTITNQHQGFYGSYTFKLQLTINGKFYATGPWTSNSTQVHRLTIMMQWLNLTKCGLVFNIVSAVVNTLLPSVLQDLDSCGIKALILILEKVLFFRYDLIAGPILLHNQVFFHGGEQLSQMVPNKEV